MPAPRAAILLSTFNGARFLQAQLDSFCQQREADWVLFWRDDGSTDETVAVMERFAAAQGEARCRRVEGDAHLGASRSFLTLLRAAAQTGLPLAFSDQDDVWLPEKLRRALAALEGQEGPVLYCSRQLLVDEALRPIGPSAPLHRAPGFPAALTQNIATGCTVVLNPAASRLVAQSRPPDGTLHDWWSYLAVTAGGGSVVADPEPTVRYRQHGGNLVGAPRSRLHRARAALKRGPNAFMAILRAHVEALLDQPALLAPDAHRALKTIHRALRRSGLARVRALALPGLVRQTRAETALFRWWFLVG